MAFGACRRASANLDDARASPAVRFLPDRLQKPSLWVFSTKTWSQFSLLLGDLAAFDCRISQLPSLGDVVDYLRWRHEDAHRNALNAHCYWVLRGEDLSVEGATKRLLGLSVAEKNELLFSRAGINFNDLPLWQKRGIGLYWETYEKAAQNPKSGEELTTTRRRLVTDLELPMRDAYSSFVEDLIAAAD